jgi:hypothetical protein
MNTSQPTPAIRAAWATARAWLPALAAVRAGAERGQLGQRAAQLERAGDLQRLGLQHDRPAGELAQIGARDRRRRDRATRDRALRRVEVDARAQLGEAVTVLARVLSVPDRLHGPHATAASCRRR